MGLRNGCAHMELVREEIRPDPVAILTGIRRARDGPVHPSCKELGNDAGCPDITSRLVAAEEGSAKSPSLPQESLKGGQVRCGPESPNRESADDFSGYVSLMGAIC